MNRDPFARSTLYREMVRPWNRKPCAWCGLDEGKFCYYWEGDAETARLTGPAKDNLKGFCSIGCYRSYHE